MGTHATAASLYRALADGGPQTVRELAERTGATETVARTWLADQTERDRVAYDRRAGVFALTQPDADAATAAS